MQFQKEMKEQCELFQKKLKFINMVNQPKQEYINLVASNMHLIKQRQQNKAIKQSTIELHQNEQIYQKHRVSITQQAQNMNQTQFENKNCRTPEHKATHNDNYEQTYSTIHSNSDLYFSRSNPKKNTFNQIENTNKDIYSSNKSKNNQLNISPILDNRNNGQSVIQMPSNKRNSGKITQDQHAYNQDQLSNNQDIQNERPNQRIQPNKLLQMNQNTHAKQPDNQKNSLFPQQSEIFKQIYQDQELYALDQTGEQKEKVKTQQHYYNEIELKSNNKISTQSISNNKNTNNIRSTENKKYKSSNPNIQNNSNDVMIVSERDITENNQRIRGQYQAKIPQQHDNQYKMNELMIKVWDDAEIVILTKALSQFKLDLSDWNQSFQKLKVKYDDLAREKNLPLRSIEEIKLKIKGDAFTIYKNDKQKQNMIYKNLFDKSASSFI